MRAIAALTALLLLLQGAADEAGRYDFGLSIKISAPSIEIPVTIRDCDEGKKNEDEEVVVVICLRNLEEAGLYERYWRELSEHVAVNIVKGTDSCSVLTGGLVAYGGGVAELSLDFTSSYSALFQFLVTRAVKGGHSMTFASAPLKARNHTFLFSAKAITLHLDFRPSPHLRRPEVDSSFAPCGSFLSKTSPVTTNVRITINVAGLLIALTITFLFLFNLESSILSTQAV